MAAVKSLVEMFPRLVIGNDSQASDPGGYWCGECSFKMQVKGIHPKS